MLADLVYIWHVKPCISIETRRASQEKQNWKPARWRVLLTSKRNKFHPNLVQIWHDLPCILKEMRRAYYRGHDVSAPNSALPIGRR